MKICNVCKEQKPKKMFSKRAKSVDGLSYSCKKCDRERLRLKYDLEKKIRGN